MAISLTTFQRWHYPSVQLLIPVLKHECTDVRITKYIKVRSYERTECFQAKLPAFV